MISQIIADMKADAGLTALVGSRIYRGLVPQGTLFPLILFEANQEIQNTLSGPSSLQKYEFDYEIHAESYVSAKAILNALKVALSAGSGYSYTITFVDDGRFNDEIGQYTLTATINFWG